MSTNNKKKRNAIAKKIRERNRVRRTLDTARKQQVTAMLKKKGRLKDYEEL